MISEVITEGESEITGVSDFEVVGSGMRRVKCAENGVGSKDNLCVWRGEERRQRRKVFLGGSLKLAVIKKEQGRLKREVGIRRRRGGRRGVDLIKEVEERQL